MPLAPLGPNNRNDNTIRCGSIVEYEQHGKPVLSRALSEQRGKWLVKNCFDAEVEIASTRLYLYPPVPTALQNTALAEISAQADEKSSTIDLEKVWEHFNSRNREYTITELAQVIFGNDLFFSHLITRRAMLGDKVYFKRGKGVFEPRPKEQVEELRLKAEAERLQALKRQLLLEALLKRIGGEQADLPPGIEWFEQIAATGRAGENHHEAVEIFNQAAAALAEKNGGQPLSGPMEERVFQFLAAIGHFDQDQNLSFLRRRRPVQFDAEIINETKRIVAQSEKPIEAGRLDLRNLLTIAIDNTTTRDVDDALSLEQTAEGFRIGIHISDVSALIGPESELFKEALYRATTVYCVDLTAPMLPAELSEGALSLLEASDRRALSFLVYLDSRYSIQRREVVRSIIRVTKRFNYDQVDRLLYDEPGAGEVFGPEVSKLLLALWEIAAHNEVERVALGATQMPRRELFPELDAEGRINFVESGEETPGHRMVGELMILANETGALFARDNNIPLAFRAQEPPDQPIEEAVAGTPDGPAREYHRRGMLKRSTVAPEPLPHFGLGVAAYAQLSSPIRRAGDLINEMQLTSFLVSGQPRFSAAEIAGLIEQLEGGLDEAQIIQRERRRYFLIKSLAQRGTTELEGTIVRTDPPRPLVELDRICTILTFNPTRGLNHSTDPNGSVDRSRIGQRVRLRITKADLRRELLFLDEI